MTAPILRDYQHDMLERLRIALKKSRRVLLQAPTGCHAPGTMIMLANGRTKPVETVTIGDRLMGPDDRGRKVLALHFGRDQMYRITPTKGDAFTVNSGHVLSLQSTNEGKKHGRTGREIIEITVSAWLAKSRYFRHVHKLRRVPIDFRAAKRPDLDPYVLGLLLGDGCIWRMVEIISEDHEVLSAVRDEMARHGLIECDRSDARIRKCRTMRYIKPPPRNSRVANPVMVLLRSLGLRNAKAGDKFVPDCYKYTDLHTRREVLAGLIDTDGSLGVGGFDFISKSERLAKDVMWLSRSLGLAAYVRSCVKAAQTGTSGTYWRVSISGDTDSIPTRIPKKQAPVRRQKKNPLVTGFSITEVGVGPFYGFELSGDHLYLTDDFTVHHNSGKGVVIAHMIAGSAAKGLSSQLLAHRRELIDQLSDSLTLAGVRHGKIVAGRISREDRAQVASVQTLVRRLKTTRAPNLLAIDEAHHSPAMSYQKIIDHCKDSWIVGLTATPSRTDGRGLDDLFDDIVIGPKVKDLIDAGYLSSYRIFDPGNSIDLARVKMVGGDYARGQLESVVNQGKITGNAVHHYLKLVAPRTCLVYCVSRQHARDVEAAYRAAGVDARYCAGDTPDLERHEIIRGFKRGSPAVVVSVDLFGEGLDAPGLQAVQLLRPTASLVLFLQQVGRVLRVEEGKDRAIILDHVGNTMQHGLPCDERDWTLAGRKTRRGQENAPPIQTCKACFAVFHISMNACPECGLAVERIGREIAQVDGELSEVDIEERRRQRKREEWTAAAAGLPALVALAKARGYKKGWVPIYWLKRNPKESFGTVWNQVNQLWREVA